MKIGLASPLQECACGEGTFCLEWYVQLINQADPTDEEYLSSLAYVKSRFGAYL